MSTIRALPPRLRTRCISLSADTLKKLGLFKTLRIGFSYVRSALFPIRNESSLEDFFINRFGRELYLTFFKSFLLFLGLSHFIMSEINLCINLSQ